MSLQPPKGTKDILPDEYKLFSNVLNIAKHAAELFCYNEYSTPIFEYTSVFERSLGDASDIVNKEMYTFLDRKERSLTLRPEFTASVVRSVASNGMQHNLPLKLFLQGPLFRYERPQKGRYRQFHQINFENIGDSTYKGDVEIIALASHIISKLNINDVTLEINTLGDAETRTNYTKKLVEYLNKYKDNLSYDSKIRLVKNPLRILDSKDLNDRKILQEAPSIQDVLTDNSRAFFNNILENLNSLKINYKINSKLVRGLDYYTGTVFEFTTTKLGAQGTVLAGGRYDGLFKKIANIDMPATGFAGGIERLMELQTLEHNNNKYKNAALVVALDECFISKALALSDSIRKANIPSSTECYSSPSKAIKKALKLNDIKFIVFIGEEESTQSKITVRNLHTHEQELLSQKELIAFLQKS